MTNDQRIYNTAINDGMPEDLALLIVAQARHETGNYKHRFFTTGKNAFGYMYVRGAKWQLPAPGPTADNQQPIAQYASVENSVHELTDWIKRRQKDGKFPSSLRTITTPQQYAELLKKSNYYGAPLATYANALTAWLRQILSEQILTAKTGSIAAVLLILGVVFRKQIFGAK